MPRIAGVNIPDNKRIEIALTYVYGIGRTLSNKILAQAKIDPNIRAQKLLPEETNRLKEIIEKGLRVEGELRRERMMNIKRLKDIGSYRGALKPIPGPCAEIPAKPWVLAGERQKKLRHPTKLRIITNFTNTMNLFVIFVKN